MDGGSTDGTVDILKSYGNRVRYISRSDRGQADAINQGFRRTEGQIFTFLNADDTYLPGAISKVARQFRENPAAGMIYGEAYHVREDGEIIDRYPTLPFDRHELIRGCFICQPAAFMLREAFSQAGMLNADLHYALDYELWMRISKIYRVLKIDDFLANSRMHLANKTLAHRTEVYREVFSVLKLHFGYVPFQWTIGRACYALSGRDQFFEPSPATPLCYLLSLVLGTLHNPRQPVRFCREWLTALGLGQRFTGRWNDGWISRRYETERSVADDCEEVVIKGRHEARIRGALRLTVGINRKEIGEVDLVRHGPFEIRLNCPPEFWGRNCWVSVVANKTFRPMKGDYRRVSCRIDSLEFRHPESRNTNPSIKARRWCADKAG